MDRVVIPGKATYTPVALSDVLLGAPVASRLLFASTAPGQVVTAATMGYYAGSATRDWWHRRKVRSIDFRATFGADVDHLEAMPWEARRAEVTLLGHALNDGFVATKPSREQLAQRINDRLTAYIASITDQEVITSSQIRSFNFARVVMPFAIGTCDVISGDVAIFQDTGFMEPHVIAHEFCHRKGYLKELHAQALAFLALRTSDDPVLVQAARIERLHRQLRVIERDDPGKPAIIELIESAHLRPELHAWFLELGSAVDAAEGLFTRGMKALYEKRMRLTGQNGMSDYDEGFTNFLWTFQRSTRSTRPVSDAAI